MYFSEGNLDPLVAYKFYKSKLNADVPCLWQRPKTGLINYSDETWFEPRIVGRDMLHRFMKINLENCVLLDGEYTNHSIRATVKEYSVQCPDNKRKELFDSLSNALLPSSTVAAPSTSTSNDLPSDLVDVKISLPSFNLEPIDFETIDDRALAKIVEDIEHEMENIDPNPDKNNTKKTEDAATKKIWSRMVNMQLGTLVLHGPAF